MNENLDELTRQLEMLNDLPTEDELMASLGGVAQPVQPVSQPVGVPQTPENPLNVGVVTNNIMPNTIQQVPMQPQNVGVSTTSVGTQPIQQVMQEQVNNQAQAQVVQQTTTMNPQPVQQVMQQPIQPQMMTSQVTKPDLSIFDKDEDEPVFVNIGEVVQENKIPFVDLKPGEATRIMLFTREMLTVYTHYIPEIGFIRCLSKRDERGYLMDKAPCCMFKDDEGKEIYAKIKRILPVIEYPVSKDGKSLLANAKPQLKFMIITLADLKSLNAILLDENTAKVAMESDFFVTIDKDDRFKTKVFSSTFNTIRAQWINDIKEEVQKFSRDLIIQARDERFRKVPVEKIQQALQKDEAAKQQAELLANNQTQMFGPTLM